MMRATPDLQRSPFGPKGVWHSYPLAGSNSSALRQRHISVRLWE